MEVVVGGVGGITTADMPSPAVAGEEEEASFAVLMNMPSRAPFFGDRVAMGAPEEVDETGLGRSDRAIPGPSSLPSAVAAPSCAF